MPWRVAGSLAAFWMVVIAFTLLVPACRHDDASATARVKPSIKVICTIGVLSDAAFNIGYPRAEVVGLINGPANPHTFEPTDEQLKLVADADVVLSLGLDLERRAAPMLSRARGAKSPVVTIGDGIERSTLIFPPELGGMPDPHVWFDASLWAKAVMGVRDALIKADPAGRAQYEKNAAEYASQIEDLHGRTTREAASVPRGNRVLVSSHGSFAYFARAYGFDSYGLEGVTGDSPVTPADIAKIADLVTARKVPAIFIDIHTPPDSIERLAESVKSRGHDVLVSGPLYGSSLGKEGTPEGTYRGMFVHNLGHIFTDLGGSPPHDHK